ncbi:hypothetical protein Taro_034439 [Colocasia esculenta]|uniref:Uncharacterized protein n=1 Tax=Colocasia esculenta TaxID=4460 RepID=A0A843W7L8_COLES|nr:hypothetical protein [Colocasia esculenta]
MTFGAESELHVMQSWQRKNFPRTRMGNRARFLNMTRRPQTAVEFWRIGYSATAVFVQPCRKRIEQI